MYILLYSYDTYKHIRSNFVAQACLLLRLLSLSDTSVSSISMPREIEVTWGIVVNGRPVPSELKRMTILDPYQLVGDVPDPRSLGPLDTLEERFLVDFKATGDVIWLEDALHLEHKSWKTLQRQKARTGPGCGKGLGSCD